MKKIFIILLIGSFSIHMNGQNEQFLELAKESIDYFKSAITAQNFTYYGLSSEEAINNLSIGDAIKHHAIGLRDLQKYDSLVDPMSIIKDMGYVSVPLMQKDKNVLETFVMLKAKDGKYQKSGIGEAPAAEKFLKYISENEYAKTAKLIRIPALNTAYIGIEKEGELYLAALFGEEQKEASLRPAKLVLTELAKQIGQDDLDVPR